MLPTYRLQEAVLTGRKRGREERDGDGEGAACKLARITFDGWALKDVALFLRFLYHPEEVTSDNMGKLGKDALVAVARLAHKYNVRGLLGAVDDWLATPPSSFKSEQVRAPFLSFQVLWAGCHAQINWQRGSRCLALGPMA
jgi:hypothetical protein